MHQDHITPSVILAMVCPQLHETRALDHVDMAIDLLRVLHLAMRAGEFHQEGDVTAMADVTSSALQILLNARETMNAAEARDDR